jgi:hypothetical protein
MIRQIAGRNRLPGYHVAYDSQADLVAFSRREAVKAPSGVGETTTSTASQKAPGLP